MYNLAHDLMIYLTASPFSPLHLIFLGLAILVLGFLLFQFQLSQRLEKSMSMIMLSGLIFIMIGTAMSIDRIWFTKPFFENHVLRVYGKDSWALWREPIRFGDTVKWAVEEQDTGFFVGLVLNRDYYGDGKVQRFGILDARPLLMQRRNYFIYTDGSVEICQWRILTKDCKPITELPAEDKRLLEELKKQTTL